MEQSRKFVGNSAVDLLNAYNSVNVGSHVPKTSDDWLAGEIQYNVDQSPQDPECKELPLPITIHKLLAGIPKRNPVDQGNPPVVGPADSYPNAAASDIARIDSLLVKECELRIGQANDALRKIREDLSQLAWQFCKQVRLADSVKDVTRSWDSVRLLNRHWRDYRQVYLRARKQMCHVKGTHDVDETHPDLAMSDCYISPIIVDRNAHGQRNSSLSWIWTANVLTAAAPTAGADPTDAYILECVCFSSVQFEFTHVPQFIACIIYELGRTPNDGQRSCC